MEKRYIISRDISSRIIYYVFMFSRILHYPLFSRFGHAAGAGAGAGALSRPCRGGRAARDASRILMVSSPFGCVTAGLLF